MTHVYVINGSPRKEKSDTLKLANAFISGLKDVQVEYATLYSMDIKDCIGCHACWTQTPGVCCQKDDMVSVLEAICSADIVIWTTPLYSYGTTPRMKAVIDRLQPLSSPAQNVWADGSVHHECRANPKTRHILISGCGFPQLEHNYEALIFQFERCFGHEIPRILCMEAPLLGIPEAAPLAEKYLALTREAGECYASTGMISAELASKLAEPMFDPETYRRMASGEK